MVSGSSVLNRAGTGYAITLFIALCFGFVRDYHNLLVSH